MRARWFTLALVLASLPSVAAAQAMDVRERSYVNSIRVIVGSPSTGHWAPAYGVRGTRAQQEQTATTEAMRLCAANPGSPTDCQSLHIFGPGAGCATIARRTGRIAGASGPTPEAARAAALAACQQDGGRCTASTVVYCFR